MELIQTIPAENTLGESVLWDVEAQALWWTDIQERRLFRYDWEGRSLDRFQTPERVGSFGLVAGSDKLVVAFESGFALYDPVSAEAEWLARPQSHVPGIRFNDGRVDRQGRFWAGTMAEADSAKGKANLYCLDAKGHARARESGITISNSLCWSPDGRLLYFADSPKHAINVYDFDVANGEILNRRLFARLPENAFPDGSTVDAQGYLWNAEWGAGRVTRHAPDGSIERALEVPATQPTCMAFGGPDLDLLFVTSARENLSAEVLAKEPAGDVFVYKTDIKGLAEGRYISDRI
jgi:sugar lactone lactonase YvrE